MGSPSALSSVTQRSSAGPPPCVHRGCRLTPGAGPASWIARRVKRRQAASRTCQQGCRGDEVASSAHPIATKAGTQCACWCGTTSSPCCMIRPQRHVWPRPKPSIFGMPLLAHGMRQDRISGGSVPPALHPQGTGRPDEAIFVTLVAEIQPFSKIRKSKIGVRLEFLHPQGTGRPDEATEVIRPYFLAPVAEVYGR
jgi:hypothetical protein